MRRTPGWLVFLLLAVPPAMRAAVPEPVPLPSALAQAHGATFGDVYGLRTARRGVVFVASLGSAASSIWGLAPQAGRPHLLSERGHLPFLPEFQSGLVAAGGLVFWSPQGGISRPGTPALWRSDGSPAGTFPIVMPDKSFPFLGASLGEAVLFVADGGLYRSDGTAAGTFLLRALPPTRFFVTGRDPSSLLFVHAGDRVYLAARDSSMSWALLVSNGTVPGSTTLLPFGELPRPADMLGHRGELFLLRQQNNELELWVHRRRVAPLQRLTFLRGQLDGAGLVGGDDAVCFRASAAGRRLEIWCSDGTSQGTRRVAWRTTSGAATASPRPTVLVPFDGRWLFSALNGQGGDELWVTTADPERPQRLGELCPGPCKDRDEVGRVLPLPGRLLLRLADRERRFHWWSWARGDREPSVLLAPGLEQVVVRAAAQMGEAAVFIANRNGQPSQLFRTNGTAEGTTLLGTFAREHTFLQSLDLEVLEDGGRLVLVTRSGSSELWSASLEAPREVTRLAARAGRGGLALPMPGTRVAPMWPHDGGVLLENEALARSKVWFVPPQGPPRPAAAPVSASSHQQLLARGGKRTAFETVIGDHLFFISAESGSSQGLSYKVECADLRQGGTVELARGALEPRVFVEWRGKTVFGTTDFGTNGFGATGGVSSSQLWSSDGTPEGTRELTLGKLDADLGGPSALAPVGETLYLFVQSRKQPALAVEIFRLNADGQPARRVSRRVFRIDPSPNSHWPSFVALGKRLVFAAEGDERGFEPWVSDGTEAGTRLLGDLAPGPASSFPRALVATRDRAFFVADDGSHGLELWETDGTEAGTRRVADLLPGVGSSEPSFLTVVGETLFFQAYDAEGRLQLFRHRP